MRIYLAKSNNAPSWAVDKIKKALNGHEILVVEYSTSKGELENNRSLVDCEAMIVIPGYYTSHTPDKGLRMVTIGKGLYSQLEMYSKNHPPGNIYIFDYGTHNYYKFDHIAKIKRADASVSDYVEYGKAYMKVIVAYTFSEVLYQLGVKPGIPLESYIMRLIDFDNKNFVRTGNRSLRRILIGRRKR